jgi:hypothetical protein
VQVDGNDMKTPGWRYNYWELKGVPLRVEVGPRDVEQGTCVLARRDMPGELFSGCTASCCWLQLPVSCFPVAAAAGCSCRGCSC